MAATKQTTTWAPKLATMTEISQEMIENDQILIEIYHAMKADQRRFLAS
ncbi:hypothetical protein SH139x_000600 [Planctomycetaceae bacterium SH139]